MSSHSSLSQSIDGIPISSVRLGKAIGFISTPPIPTDFNNRNSLEISCFLTLSPSHHHLINGRYFKSGSRKILYKLSFFSATPPNKLPLLNKESRLENTSPDALNVPFNKKFLLFISLSISWVLSKLIINLHFLKRNRIQQFFLCHIICFRQKITNFLLQCITKGIHYLNGLSGTYKIIISLILKNQLSSPFFSDNFPKTILTCSGDIVIRISKCPSSYLVKII